MSLYFNKKVKGYLLIDVLVVLGIIALLSTISIPFIKKYQPNLKLSGTARDLVADLRLAQQLTVTEQVAHAVIFNLINNSYQILKLDVATTTIKSVNFIAEVSYQQITGLTNNQVVFNYYGGVSEAGQVVLININANTVAIIIKPSGYIQLVD
ncbi:MAG: hypothetical protein ABH830_02525 [Patescibacteria group bacterium]